MYFLKCLLINDDIVDLVYLRQEIYSQAQNRSETKGPLKAGPLMFVSSRMQHYACLF